MPAHEKPIIFIRQGNLAEAQIAEARRLAPGYEVIHSEDPQAVAEKIERLEVLFGYLPRDLMPQARALRWLHMGGIGFHAGSPRVMEDDVTVTNCAGMASQPIAEAALAMIFSFQRFVHLCRDSQAKREWNRPEVAGRIAKEWAPIHTLTLGIVGYGNIGRRLAEMARGLGMRVLALRKHLKPDPFAEEVLGPEGLERIMRESHYVVCLLPGTEEARRFIDRSALEKMRPDAVIMNFGRGACIDQEALTEVLAEGRIRGAGLDVFEREPLPAESPLWGMPNVLVHFHVSGLQANYEQIAMDAFLKNLERYVKGEPLLNVIDKARGY